jgi:hypothetical protein
VAGLEEQVAQAVAARDALQILLTAAQVPTPVHCKPSLVAINDVDGN